MDVQSLKKFGAIALIILAASLFTAFMESPVYAEEAAGSYTEENPTAEVAEVLGQELAGIHLPEEAQDFFSGEDLSIENPESILKLGPKDIFGYLWEEIKERLTEPLRLLGGLLVIILLTAVLEGLGSTVTSHSLEQMFSTLSVLLCVAILSAPIITAMTVASGTIRSGADFLLSFVPIFASIVAVSGGVTSAGSYSAVVLTAAEIFSQLATMYLMPMLGLCMALSVVDAANPTISLSGMTGAVKRVATWGLGLMLTIFVGLLTIQSIVGVSADSLAARTGKYMVSNLVPVVGGAISDAYSTIKGSLGILRGGVGIFGIAALVCTVLPAVLSVLSIQISVGLGAVAAELLGVKGVERFLKSTGGILSIAMGLLLCFLVLLIISTAIVLMLGMQLA